MDDSTEPARQDESLLGYEQSISTLIKRKPVGSPASRRRPEIIETLPGKETPWEKTKHLLSGNDTWFWETAAVILSLAAVLGLIFVLRHVDGEPQTSWTFKISPNTVISLLSTTARSSSLVTISAVIGQEKWMWFGLGSQKGFRKDTRLIDLQIFEDASRGPLGSLSLIWFTQMRRFASIGALLTILSLAMDPFTQQVLEVEFRASTAVNNLTVASDVQRSERYDAYTPPLESTNSSGSGNNPVNLVTLGMRAAIINGLMTSPIQNVSLQCPTGNCQWPTIPSLAICSECVDLTGMLKSISNDSNNMWTLPNGVESLNYTYMNLVPQWYASSNRYGASVIPYLSIFDMITTPSPQLSLQAPTALECALWPCIQALNFSTIQGTQTQIILKTYSAYIDNMPPIAINDTVQAIDIRAETTLQLENHILAPTPVGFNTLSNASYSISDASFQAIATLLNTTFSGNPHNDSYGEGIQSLVPTNGQLDAVSNLMSNLALSMTNHIRLNPALTNENGTAINPWHEAEYVGQAWTTQSYFRVRWLWMILPIIVVVASTVFLWAAALQNWVCGVRIWKGSLLPVLFFSMGEGIRGRFSLNLTTREMQDFAESIRGGFL